MHMVMHASIIAIMLAMSIAIGRMVIRIMVLHMSAQFMHMAMDFSMPVMPIELLAHIVQACSHAAHASMRSCMALMSMPSIAAVDPSIIAIMSMEKCYVVLRDSGRGLSR
jgi:hypothetical protein